MLHLATCRMHHSENLSSCGHSGQCLARHVLFCLSLTSIIFYPFLIYSTSTESDVQVKLASFEVALRWVSLRVFGTWMNKIQWADRSLQCVVVDIPSLIRPSGIESTSHFCCFLSLAFPSTVWTWNTIVLQLISEDFDEERWHWKIQEAREKQTWFEWSLPCSSH